jgi:hypothetical protein
MNIRTLDTAKIIETAERLGKRIDSRFPGSGLSQIAAGVAAQTRESILRAEAISRPIWWLRISLIVLGVLLLVALALAWREAMPDNRIDRVLHVLDATKGGAVYVLAFALFVVTLEYRLKRRRALRAIHELRALAHIIDMHQLTKDHGLLGQADGPKMPSGALMTAADVATYLHYCSELLSLLSKIGQLYVQDFADAPTLAAVDQFEGLATGLTQKIWQKLMILDRVRDDCPVPATVGPLAPLSPLPVSTTTTPLTPPTPNQPEAPAREGAGRAEPAPTGPPS